MVNDLRDLLSDSVASPPHDDLDLTAVLATGRRRVRRRRLRLAGGTTLATAAIVAATTLVSLEPSPPDLTAAGVPRPDAPTLRLADATSAVAGEDYRVLESHTTEDLDHDNGQYFEGVTDDGLILFRDGPQMDQPRPRFALLDPASGAKDWLPELDVEQETSPVELGEDRLVLVSAAGDGEEDLQAVAHVFDRRAREWTSVSWPGLPGTDRGPADAAVGPDDRLYVPVRDDAPAGPLAGAEEGAGDTYRLWSASLSDPDDVRDEGLTVGSVAFTDGSMLWTDGIHREAGLVHVRDLATGAERSFDPRSGDRCSLLSFGAVADTVVLGQYCGTYDDGVRDDRVQVLDHEGNQVVTVQGSGIEGWLTSRSGAGVVTVTSYEHGAAGTYAYDVDSQRFLRISTDVSSWVTSGPTQGDQLLWNTPVNGDDGMTQHLGVLLD